MFTRQNGYHGPHFRATRVRNCIALTVEDQLVAQEGLGIPVGKLQGIFCEDDRDVGSRDPEWLQGALNMLICLFYWYGLVAIIANCKSMKYKLGTIRSEMLEEAMEQRCTERGSTYQEWLRRQLPDPDCRVQLTVGLITEASV